MYLEAKVINESGYEAAIQGLAMSKKATLDRACVVAKTLAFKDGGHNKFLESIQLWVKVRAPRYWWQEGDTYRISTKQSESTMHTLVNELKRLADLPGGSDECDEVRRSEVLDWISRNFEPECQLYGDLLRDMLTWAGKGQLVELKANLPEGFLQTRMWCFNYKTFRNMYLQRVNHRLPHWPQFLSQVIAGIEHPELILEPDYNA